VRFRLLPILDCCARALEVLGANQDLEPLGWLLKQPDVLRAKKKSVAATEPGKFIQRPFTRELITADLLDFAI
jgi:hypothetical protein